jgi:uncharacterized membrane protein
MQKQVPNWIIIGILMIAFIGFFDAVYLTTNHYSGTVVPCFITGGCDQVTTSEYSKILGIPVALLGALYYLTVLFFGMYYAQKRNFLTFKLLNFLTYFGFGFSMWFVYVQANIIGAWCIYCLVSASTSTLLFILSNVGMYGKGKSENME